MTAPEIVVVAGSRWRCSVTLYEPVANVFPLEADLARPVTVTGWTAKMQVRRDYDAAVVIDLSTAKGTIVNGGVNGTFSWTVSTVGIPPEQYLWELDVTEPGAVGPDTLNPSDRLRIRPQVTV